ncbi:hypothetical protein ADK70_17905 [Streptomyces rimosus subsp. pseudoverticillatus]|uniref:hypothetical protein n=1 Tax=Streptomyces rimosus TaxID=1927 RepID=UPI0006B28973|nr:hypothetical protein [Streptomyces rimosus]KOT90144.1 hypothetical protein ADK70_17905 [Streptomyces rimosus subsp. pseudoverticillatus]
MYAFGMLALLGLAVLVVTQLAHRFLSAASEFWAFAFVALGVGTAWLANFDLFGIWGLTARNDAIGITLTGFLIAGAGYFWREVLRFFTGLSRKLSDEAASLEKTQQLRRVA